MNLSLLSVVILYKKLKLMENPIYNKNRIMILIILERNIYNGISSKFLFIIMIIY